MKTKTFFIVIVFIFLSLVGYGLFPIKDAFQQFIVMIVFFTILPLIFNKLILKRSLADIGVQAGDWRQGLKWCGISSVGVILIFLMAAYFFDFFKNYKSAAVFVGYNFISFAFYELLAALFIVFVYEFFFQGFVMLTLELKMSRWAIIAQALIFLIAAVIMNSVGWAFLPYIIFAPFAGVIAYKSRSIFYSSALQIIIFIILDASVVRMAK